MVAGELGLSLEKRKNFTTYPKKRELKIMSLGKKIGLEINDKFGIVVDNFGRTSVKDIFAIGDHVDVIGTSKGRGFAGGVKRFNFKGGPRTHGQSDRERAPGSHGSGTTPGRVYKGVRAPGHYGNARITSSNLKVAFLDTERNLIGVRGSVPGARNGLIMIKEARKA